MGTQTLQEEKKSMVEKDVLERISSRRIRIPQKTLERFKGGDLRAISMHCVDGRPDEKKIDPYMQCLGGAFGFFVALIGADREMFGPKCNSHHLQKVEDVILSSFCKKTLIFHSDNHNSNHCGCGFLKSVMEDPEAFGLKSQDWQRIERLLPKARRINVVGEHKEVGILIVTTPEFILKADEQFFVHHKFLDDIALFWLCRKTAQSLGLDSEKFFKVACRCRDDNITTTLKKLKADKLPVITIK